MHKKYLVIGVYPAVKVTGGEDELEIVEEDAFDVEGRVIESRILE